MLNWALLPERLKYIVMKEKIEAVLAEIESLACKSESEIEEARVRLLGKKGEIPRLFDEFRTVASDQKREFGQKLNQLKNAAVAKIAQMRDSLQHEVLPLYLLPEARSPGRHS